MKGLGTDHLTFFLVGVRGVCFYPQPEVVFHTNFHYMTLFNIIFPSTENPRWPQAYDKTVT